MPIHRKMDQHTPPDDDPRQPPSEELQRVPAPEVLDPVALRMLVGGGIAIGLILAARVKQLGQIEFYDGIPDKLPDVVRAGLELPPS